MVDAAHAPEPNLIGVDLRLFFGSPCSAPMVVALQFAHSGLVWYSS